MQSNYAWLQNMEVPHDPGIMIIFLWIASLFRPIYSQKNNKYCIMDTFPSKLSISSKAFTESVCPANDLACIIVN